MTAFWWFLPLVAGLSTCAGPCDVLDGTTDAVGGTMDDALGTVDQTVGTAVDGIVDSVTHEPAKEERPTVGGTSKAWQQVQGVAATTPWWVTVGASLLAALTLFQGPLAGLFSRIRHDKVLDHPTRRAALDLVQSEPGATVQQLATRAGVSWQTMRGHLRRLEAHGMVVAQRAGKHRHYFAQGTQAAHARSRLAVLQAAARRRIAELLVREPGLDQAGLCRRLGIGNPSASKHLARLQRAGLIEAHPDGRRRRYAPTPALTGALGL